MKKQFETLSKKGWIYLAVVVALSIPPYFFIIKEGSTETEWTMLLMWMPALAAIVMRLKNREGLFKGMSWNPLKHFSVFLLAAFLPFFIEIVSILIGHVVGALTINPEYLTVSDGLISVRGIALILSPLDQPWYVFVPNYLVSFFIGTLLYSLAFALGEEYGWRGYLQKEWASKNSLFGFVAVGIVWGLWHLPGILLGHNYPDYPILGGFILMPFLTSVFSVCFGLAFNKTRVIWIPVVFHGSINISAEISNAAVIDESIINSQNDLIWTGLWVITGLAFWLLRTK